MSNSRSAAGAAGGGSAGTLASWTLRPATVWQIRKQQRQYWRLMRATPQSSAAEAASRSGSSLTVEEQDRLCEELAAFLREDLQHLFDDQGIDASRYDDRVEFVDPITKYGSIKGYMFNIAMLRRVFSPTFTLHDIRRTGPLELTTRWTMTMCLSLARAAARSLAPSCLRALPPRDLAASTSGPRRRL